mgnify:CR=1 FL=1
MRIGSAHQVLPAASFRFQVAPDTLAVRLTVPTITVTGTAPVKALRTMPGAPQKSPGPNGPGLANLSWECTDPFVQDYR